MTETILGRSEAVICRPWLRHILPRAEWQGLIQAAASRSWQLLAHWADTAQVHALFLDPDLQTAVPVSTPVEDGAYPALSAAFPAALPYQRMIRDLWGHQASGALDVRPWLDHGHWPLAHPMAARPGAPNRPEPLEPEIADTDGLALLPLGPVLGRPEEAAHLRLTLDGSAIRHAEPVLGFTHKGTLHLMRNKSPRAAARFAARLSADATVAHAVAFAAATESALDLDIPPRASRLRVAMQEMERIAVHLDTLARVGRLAGAPAIEAEAGHAREILLRAAEAAFGHRLMMDCVVPGGVAADLPDGGSETILRALGEAASRLPAIRRLYARSSVSTRLTGIGRVTGTTGVAGRAAGHAFDPRGVFAKGYDGLSPRLILSQAGDAAARQSVRILEIEESLRLISLVLERLPGGPVLVPLPQLSGEGIGCAESAHGDIWHWLRIDHGQIAAIFPRDPGWDLWPLARRALAGADAEDAALIQASLALPVSGMDL